MDLAGQEHVHDPLHVEHVNGAVAIDVRSSNHIRIRLDPQEHVHA